MNIITRTVSTCLSILFLQIGLLAQFEGKDLSSYLTQAQTANPGLLAFEHHYEAAKQRIPQTSTFPDPMLQITHFVESVQTRTGPQENVIMLSQRLPWFGKLTNRGNVASAQAEALWYAFQSQQLMVARQVAVAYYEYGYIGHAIDLTAENLKLLQSLEPIVETRVSGGGGLNQLLRLQVEIGKVADKLQSLQEKRAIQSASLNNLLALPAHGILPWPDWNSPTETNLDPNSLRLAIEENNPELAMLERRIASAEARREIARLENFPDLTLGLNYIQIGSPVVNPSTPDAGKDPWGITVSLNIPMWLQKNRAGRSEALASQRAAEYEYENRLNALRSELSASSSKLNDAQRRLKLYGDELLGLAEQAVAITRTSYEGGKTGMLEVIDSERSLLELQLLFWRAASDAWQQRVIIQTLANQPLAGTFKATSEK